MIDTQIFARSTHKKTHSKTNADHAVPPTTHMLILTARVLVRARAVDSEHPIQHCRLQFIAVGTPSRRGDGHADLSYVYAAAEEMAPEDASFDI